MSDTIVKSATMWVAGSIGPFPERATSAVRIGTGLKSRARIMLRTNVTACLEARSVQPLDLQRTEQRFGYGVIPAIAFSAHRTAHAEGRPNCLLLELERVLSANQIFHAKPPKPDLIRSALADVLRGQGQFVEIAEQPFMIRAVI